MHTPLFGRPLVRQALLFKNRCARTSQCPANKFEFKSMELGRDFPAPNSGQVPMIPLRWQMRRTDLRPRLCKVERAA